MDESFDESQKKRHQMIIFEAIQKFRNYAAESKGWGNISSSSMETEVVSTSKGYLKFKVTPDHSLLNTSSSSPAPAESKSPTGGLKRLNKEKALQMISQHLKITDSVKGKNNEQGSLEMTPPKKSRSSEPPLFRNDMSGLFSRKNSPGMLSLPSLSPSIPPSTSDTPKNTVEIEKRCKWTSIRDSSNENLMAYRKIGSYEGSLSALPGTSHSSPSSFNTSTPSSFNTSRGIYWCDETTGEMLDPFVNEYVSPSCSSKKSSPQFAHFNESNKVNEHSGDQLNEDSSMISWEEKLLYSTNEASYSCKRNVPRDSLDESPSPKKKKKNSLEFYDSWARHRSSDESSRLDKTIDTSRSDTSKRISQLEKNRLDSSRLSSSFVIYDECSSEEEFPYTPRYRKTSDVDSTKISIDYQDSGSESEDYPMMNDYCDQEYKNPNDLRRRIMKNLMKRHFYSEIVELDTICTMIDMRLIGRHDDYIHSKLRKIFLMGDSHTRFLVNGLQKILPGFRIYAFCKPSATTEQVFSGLEGTIGELTKDDFLILLCGTNDMWTQDIMNIKRAEMFLSEMLKKTRNTNILVCNVPRNYSVDEDSHVLSNIREFNRFVKKAIEGCCNASRVNLHRLKDKLFFTKHGLHFNGTGKVKICELLSHKLVDVLDVINSR